jgi:hypothetical protein
MRTSRCSTAFNFIIRPFFGRDRLLATAGFTSNLASQLDITDGVVSTYGSMRPILGTAGQQCSASPIGIMPNAKTEKAPRRQINILEGEVERLRQAH